jgi:transposase-like protein
VRTYMQNELLKQALAKAGSIKALAEYLDVHRSAIYRWWEGGRMTIANECKLKAYLEEDQT